MLKVNKNINITGYSIINETQVAYMNASISTDGNSNANVTKTILNQELYSKNREAVRADMISFDEVVHKIEDEILGGNK